MNAKTVLIKTFGCSLNHSDSELMNGLLTDAGYNVISDYNTVMPKDSSVVHSTPDVVIINSCTVKNMAEKKFFQEMDNWKALGSKIIAAGCVPQADPSLLNFELKDIPVIGTRQLIHVVDIVENALNGTIIQDISNNYNERLNLPKVRKNGIIEILPISEGCLSNCSYCKTKQSRGELLSYPKEKIIVQFKDALNHGCKEFWITSQDNGCYGFDIYRKEKYFLPQLLNDLLEHEGQFRIRLGMSNPDHILRILPDLIKTFKHPKMFKFLHIPVQSGNDKVLKLMKRTYAVAEFKKIVEAFQLEFADISISTDVIVGFPGEDESAFQDSIELIRWLKPDVLNLSRFWLRKGTSAEKLPQILGGISKDRSEKMKVVFDELSKNKNTRWIGKIETALIDERGKNDSLIARNDYYRQIIIKNHQGLKIGDFSNIRIIKSGMYDLYGEIS